MSSPVKRRPVDAGAVAQMFQAAAAQGVDLEVTFRARPATSANAPAGRHLHATNVRSRPQAFTRQGVVPKRSKALTPTVLTVGGLVVAAFVGALIWVLVTFGAVLLGIAGVVALALLAFGGSKVTAHCPGAFHK